LKKKSLLTAPELKPLKKKKQKKIVKPFEISKDITKKQKKGTYIIIEINDSPGFDIHDYPYEGKNRHTAREFLFLMYPELQKIKV